MSQESSPTPQPATATSSRPRKGRLVDRLRLSSAPRLAGAASLLAMAGCGNQYRPVVSAVNPVGPAAQPQKYAVVVSNPNGAANGTSSGLVTLVDFSGDTVLITANVGVNPRYMQLDPGGVTGYVLNGDGTVNSFSISTTLITSNVLQVTLPGPTPPPVPVAVLATGTNLYIAEQGRNAIAQFTEASPPAFKQELQTGPGTVYTVGTSGAPRVYAISQGTAGSVGTVSAIETSTNTISNQIAVGRGPVYGVMSADSLRAYILNNTDGTVSVINAQMNAPDTFQTAPGGATASTIPVGVKPVWADFATTRAEMVVANAGNGTTPGTLSVINIPLCLANTNANPNCNPANPVDAVGFGQMLANVPVGVNPVMVTVLSDGSRAYVANAGNAALGIPGSVSVVNLQTNTVTATIPAANSTNETDSLVHGHPIYIASSNGTPTGKVYVVSSDSTDLTIIETDTDTVDTHVGLQGQGVSVRVSTP